MRDARHMPFREWTKSEIKHFCLVNGYGEVKFSGKKRIMHVDMPVSNWAVNIMYELANKIGYAIDFFTINAA